MNDKIKKYLFLTAYRGVIAVSALLLLLIINFFMPRAVRTISCIWTENTDLGRVTALLLEMIKELMPF